MRELIKKYLQGDSVIWIIFFVLCMVSIVELYSASSTLANKAATHTAPLMRHIMFLGLGACIVIAVHIVNYKNINKIAYILLGISILALIYAMFRGVSANDAKRWIGIAGIQFQPSELAKLSLIVVVADLVARAKTPGLMNKSFKIIVAVTVPICALIFKENLSTAVILFSVIFLMMIIGRVPFKKLGLLLGSIIVAGVVFIAVMHIVPESNRENGFFSRYYTWEGRITNFQKSDYHELTPINDQNRQEIHSQIAIARGGAVGVGPGNSLERNFLPQAYADFIYAIIVEELGLGGGLVVMLLYLWLLFRAGQIAWRSDDSYPSLLVIGLTLMIVIQAFVSMAVTAHVGPITGQPLPLISRGGTSILVTSVYFGIILSVTRYFKMQKKESTYSLGDNTR